MFTPLTLLLLVLAGVLLWLDGARARELATAVVDELCRRRGYQLLDETVGLARLGIAQTSKGLRFKRLFRFDYSIEGVGRQQGHILLHGAAVVQVDLIDPPESEHERTPDTTQSAPEVQQHAGKVIPFRRRD
jgi:hypothetical protein